MKINKLSKLYLLISGFILASILFPPTANAKVTEEIKENWEKLKEQLEPAKLKGRIREEIARLDIGTSLDIFDADVLNGINLASKYKYEVEPSYQNGFYTRVDKWDIKTGVNPGDWFENSLPISLGISLGTEVLFARQFQSQWDAIKSLPLTPFAIPFSAKKALKLETGTFVSIPTHLNIAFSSTLFATSGELNASMSVSYLISGQFLIHIFRLKDQKVRVKLIAVKSRGYSSRVDVDYTLEVFGIDLIGGEIKRFFGTNLIEARILKDKGDLFMVDYVLDLKYPKAREAYNELLAPKNVFKKVPVLNPFTSDRRTSELLITNLNILEEVFQEDRDKPIDERRVDRIFKGQNEFERRSTSFKIGMNLFQFQTAETLMENYITYFDRQDKKHNYLYNTYTALKKQNFLFGFYKSSARSTTYTLFRADNDGNATEDNFSDYGVTYEVKNRYLIHSEQKRIKQWLELNIPEEITSQIPWHEWLTHGVQRAARVYYQILFHKTILDDLRRYSSREIRTLFNDYMDNIDPSAYRPRHPRQFPRTHRLQLKLQKRKIIEALSNLTPREPDPDNPEQELSRRQIIKNYANLQSNRLFTKIGLGFLSSLLDREDLSEKIYFEITWTSHLIDKKTFKYGTNPRTELYDSLQFIQSVLNNRSFDLRLVKYDPDFLPE